MIYEWNVSGIEIMFRIDNYQSPAKHSFGDWWCACGFSFRFGNIINYNVEHDELLMPEEIDGLSASLTELLDGNITEPTEEFTSRIIIFYLNGKVEFDYHQEVEYDQRRNFGR